MAQSSVWQMVQDLPPENENKEIASKKKSSVKRSSSFQDQRSRTKSGSGSATEKDQLSAAPDLRRVASTYALIHDTVSRAGKALRPRALSQNYASFADVKKSENERLRTSGNSLMAGTETSSKSGKMNWAKRSFKLGKKGLEFIKKAGKKAGEILEGEGQDSDSDDFNDPESKKSDAENESIYCDAETGNETNQTNRSIDRSDRTIDRSVSNKDLSPSSSAIDKGRSPPIEVKIDFAPENQFSDDTIDYDHGKEPIIDTEQEALDFIDERPSLSRTTSSQHKQSNSSEAGDDIAPLSPENLPNLRKKMYAFDPECPIHGTNARMNHIRASLLHRHRHRARSQHTLNRGISIDTLNYSMGSDIDEFPILASQAYAAKLARKRKRTALSGDQKARVEKEMLKIKSNLCIISFAFLFLFTAFQGLQNLQSSVNRDGGLGSISLGMVYLGLACSSLILPPYMLNRLGCKLTLIMCIAIYALYLLANFIPKWYSLIPASFLLGTAASCLWAAKCTYLTETGIRYAILNVESHNVVIVRFFGIFFMIVHLGQVFGNLVSASILTRAEGKRLGPLDKVERTCGHYFVSFRNLSPEARANLERPPQATFTAVCAAYFGCAIVAMLILAMFLNTLKKDEQNSKMKPKFRLDVWHKTLDNLKKPKHLLLIPLTIFNGMEQAFIAGEFTKAYVGCCLGIAQIGYVMTSFGVADALCSLVFGPLIKLFGRMPLFMFGAVVDMLMIFTLLIWPPNAADFAIFYVIATAWGMADGVWNTQINGLWVVLFGGNLEVAFANYRLWESIGFALSMFHTPFTTTETKLYILLTVLLLGMLGYGLIEIWEPLEAYLLKVRYAAGELCNYYVMKKKKRLFPSIGVVDEPSKSKSCSEQSLIYKEQKPDIIAMKPLNRHNLV